VPPHRARRDRLGPMFPLCFAMTSFGVIIANHIHSFEGFAVFAHAVSLPLYFPSNSVFSLDRALTHAQALVVHLQWLVFLVEMNPLRLCGGRVAWSLHSLSSILAVDGPRNHRRDGRGVLPCRALQLGSHT
jgi:hypothetical protein